MTSPLRYAFLGAPVLLAALAPAPPALAQNTATRVVQGYSGCLTAPSSDPCSFQAGGPITPVVSGSSISSTVIKSTAGYLKEIDATCNGAACWLFVYNAATVPANGATTAGIGANQLQECRQINSGATGVINYGEAPSPFTTGIVAVISSTACPTQTSASVGFVHALVQ
jgi:hypothetical protein